MTRTTLEARSAEIADAREQYTGAACTLDGQPATILGRQLRVAVVARLADGLAVEFAWQTVAHVMKRDGDFLS